MSASVCAAFGGKLANETSAGIGTIVAQGTPEEVARVPESYTGQYLREVLTRKGSARDVTERLRA